jgi:hypothetical protein
MCENLEKRQTNLTTARHIYPEAFRTWWQEAGSTGHIDQLRIA